MNVEVSLVLQLLFVSRTLKNVFVGIFRGAAGYKWGKVAVMVWSVDGSSPFDPPPLLKHHKNKGFLIFLGGSKGNIGKKRIEISI